MIYGDNVLDTHEFVEGVSYTDVKYRGLPNDGDDIINIGNNPDLSYVYVLGQGGNDKIIGGLSMDNTYEYLYGGDGDDKMWANDVHEYEANGDYQYM